MIITDFSFLSEKCTIAVEKKVKDEDISASRDDLDNSIKQDEEGNITEDITVVSLDYQLQNNILLSEYLIFYQKMC